jgi:hypothetical protein
VSDHETRIESVIKVIAAFVWNLHLKRVLHGVDPDPRLNFWRVIYGNLFDMAVIEWCKLFGSHAETTHWKQVVPQADHDRFRRGLLEAVGLPHDEWTKYRDEVKDYRDTHAAHYTIPSLDPEAEVGGHYPDLGVALRAVLFYYAWLLENMPGVRGPPDLEAYCCSFSNQARAAAQKAIAATSAMDEHVR